MGKLIFLTDVTPKEKEKKNFSPITKIAVQRIHCMKVKYRCFMIQVVKRTLLRIM